MAAPTLDIEDVYQDSCGSTVYLANRSDSSEYSYTRKHLKLVDHSTRFCMDYKVNLYEAEFSEGYGFCGTSDSRLTAGGSIWEPLMVIMGM